MKKMKVNTDCSFLTKKQIKTLESIRKFKYVMETQIKNSKGEWINQPMAIFYNEKKHPQGSNYAALFTEKDPETNGVNLFIADGLSAVDGVVFQGLEAEGEVVYSRYRHDYREVKNGAFVDGGRDYFRFGGDEHNDYNIVSFKVVDGKIEIIESKPHSFAMQKAS